MNACKLHVNAGHNLSLSLTPRDLYCGSCIKNNLSQSFIEDDLYLYLKRNIKSWWTKVRGRHKFVFNVYESIAEIIISMEKSNKYRRDATTVVQKNFFFFQIKLQVNEELNLHSSNKLFGYAINRHS